MIEPRNNTDKAPWSCRHDHLSLTIHYPTLGETEQASHTEIRTLPLRQCSTESVLHDKHDNFLVTPANFDASKSTETARGKDNITSLQHIFLDNDGGDLTHEQFAAMFPKWRVVVYNTFSSTIASPRFRVIIPTRDIMTTRAYEHITQHIMGVLKRNHYYSLSDMTKTVIARNPKNMCHGFDPSKLNAANLMYLPCTNAANPEAAFFIDYEGGRNTISVYDVLRHKASPNFNDVVEEEILADFTKMDPKPVKKQTDKLAAIRAKLDYENGYDPNLMIARYKEDYQGRARGAGLSNDLFFKLGFKLKKLGLSDDLIQQELLSAADSLDRKKQIKSVMRSLKKA